MWFGYALIITSYQGKDFGNDIIIELLKNFMIMHNTSIPYYPQANNTSEVFIKIQVLN